MKKAKIRQKIQDYYNSISPYYNPKWYSMRQKSNNHWRHKHHISMAYWEGSQYSKKYARKVYKKKAPKDLYEQVKSTILGFKREYFCVDWVCVKLKVIQKHVFNVFQRLLKEGFISRELNEYGGWERYNDARHDSCRHPNMYRLKKS